MTAGVVDTSLHAITSIMEMSSAVSGSSLEITIVYTPSRTGVRLVVSGDGSVASELGTS